MKRQRAMMQRLLVLGVSVKWYLLGCMLFYGTFWHLLHVATSMHSPTAFASLYFSKQPHLFDRSL